MVIHKAIIAQPIVAFRVYRIAIRNNSVQRLKKAISV